jgi:chromosome segregation ATPase
MSTKIILLMSIVAVGFLSSCEDQKKKELVQRTSDSLRTELQANRKLTEAMVEIGTLLDSVDANRKVLRVKMVEGTNYETFAGLMHDINQYVRNAEAKIEALEKAAGKNSHNDAIYASAIKKLKGELDIRNHELDALKEQVNVYKNKNENLITTVGLQKAEIDDKLNQIKTKQEDITQLQEQVSQLMTKSKLDQGDAYFAQASAIEEAANRTHFAPRKKKNTRKEAIELYKLALNFGKEEAQARINQLEKKM